MPTWATGCVFQTGWQRSYREMSSISRESASIQNRNMMLTVTVSTWPVDASMPTDFRTLRRNAPSSPLFGSRQCPFAANFMFVLTMDDAAGHHPLQHNQRQREQVDQQSGTRTPRASRTRRSRRSRHGQGRARPEPIYGHGLVKRLVDRPRRTDLPWHLPHPWRQSVRPGICARFDGLGKLDVRWNLQLSGRCNVNRVKRAR